MVKTRRDWKGVRAVGEVVAHILRSLEDFVSPGVRTGDIDKKAAELLKRLGAVSAPRHFYDFPGSICISVNDEAVHGIPGGRILASGDLLKLDVTAIKDGYIADAARTVSVGTQSDEVRRLRRCAVKAFEAALHVIKPGALVNEIGKVVEEVVTADGFHVLRELTGHGIGKALHERPKVHNYHVKSYQERLEKGMMIALEPVISVGTSEIYTAEDGWTLKTQDGSLAAHHEHTLVVSDKHPTLITMG